MVALDIRCATGSESSLAACARRPTANASWTYHAGVLGSDRGSYWHQWDVGVACSPRGTGEGAGGLGVGCMCGGGLSSSAYLVGDGGKDGLPVCWWCGPVLCRPHLPAAAAQPAALAAQPAAAALAQAAQPAAAQPAALAAEPALPHPAATSRAAASLAAPAPALAAPQ